MLEAQSLGCERGGRRLFGPLSFGLAPGELLRIGGPNGSGKTSLLRILCGLLEPSQGEVRWKAQPIRALREDYSRELVYLGHAPAVKDELTPQENLDIACRLAGLSLQKGALREALRGYSVPDLPARKLSQGQRRRAALARLAVSENAPLWLLDEPFAALDVAAAQFTEELVQKHVARGGTVAYTTHQPSALDARSRLIDLSG